MIGWAGQVSASISNSQSVSMKKIEKDRSYLGVEGPQSGPGIVRLACPPLHWQRGGPALHIEPSQAASKTAGLPSATASKSNAR